MGRGVRVGGGVREGSGHDVSVSQRNTKTIEANVSSRSVGLHYVDSFHSAKLTSFLRFL